MVRKPMPPSRPGKKIVRQADPVVFDHQHAIAADLAARDGDFAGNAGRMGVFQGVDDGLAGPHSECGQTRWIEREIAGQIVAKPDLAAVWRKAPGGLAGFDLADFRNKSREFGVTGTVKNYDATETDAALGDGDAGDEGSN
jgi:hypothetical protein